MVLLAVLLASTAFALPSDVSARLDRALQASPVAAPQLAQLEGAAEEEDLRHALAPRLPQRFAIEFTSVCRGRQLAVPAWCVRTGQPGIGPDGEISVAVGDDVELELTVPLQWSDGRHAFIIASTESVERPDLRPAFAPAIEWGVPGVQVLKFRPDRSGEFLFFEPYGRSQSGSFSVRP